MITMRRITYFDVTVWIIIVLAALALAAKKIKEFVKNKPL